MSGRERLFLDPYVLAVAMGTLSSLVSEEERSWREGVYICSSSDRFSCAESPTTENAKVESVKAILSEAASGGSEAEEIQVQTLESKDKESSVVLNSLEVCQ